MHRSYPHPIIAREGWLFIAISVIVSLIVSYYFPVVSIVLWLVTLFVVQFFRDPPRNVPEGDYLVTSPADGRIVVIAPMYDPYRNVEALKVSVFMNVFNVHSNRSPVHGTVQQVNYFPGQFFNAAIDKASLENERNAVIACTVGGHEITFVQVAGLVARRILCYTKAGDVLRHGERYGFIRFGSRVDLYLPLDSNVQVNVGDKVKAGTTILATLPERQILPESETV